MADARSAYAARLGRVQDNAAGRLDLAVQHLPQVHLAGQRAGRVRKFLPAQLLAERPLAS